MRGYKYNLLLKDLIERPAKLFPKEEVVYRNKLRYNYAKLYERIQKLANALEDLGVKEGSKIGIFDWNTHWYLESYFAIPCMGAIMHMGNPRLSPEQVEYIINHAEDDVLFLHEDFLSLIEGIADKIDVEAYVILSEKGELPDTKLEPVYEYESWIRDQPSVYEFPDLDEDTTATMGYTTGTTGMPKGCYFSHRDGVLHSISWSSVVSYYLGLSMGDVILHIVPMFHVHSWGIPYYASMLGMKQVLPGELDPKILLELIKNEGVTYTAGVPTVLKMLLDYPKLGEYKDYLEGLTMLIGGSALSRDLCERAMNLGMKIVSGYGMSETYPVLTLAHLKPSMLNWSTEKKIDKFVKTGIPGPLVKLRVVDEKMKDVKPDDEQMGEIVVRAPWLTPEYYKDPEKTEELWKDEWLHTGDIATMDEDGYIFIKDRDKDVVKSGGEWISTITLQDVISMHPAVSEVCVIRAKHEKWDERPVALVVPTPEQEGKVTEDEIKDHLSKYPERVPKWWIPDKIIFVEEIPKTSVGKMDKKALRPKYEDILIS